MNNIINPCCTERELGQLLREAHGHAVMFQTQGDVTMTTLLKATMLMSGDRPRTLTISTPTLPQEAMRLVERYAQLGYISRLRLMLEEGQEVPAVPTDLAIVPHAPSLLIWQGSTGTIVIQGHVPDVVTPALHLYAAILGGSQSVGVLNAIAPFEALFRARRVEVNHGDWNNDSSEAKIGVPVPGDSQQTETAATSALSPQPSDIAEPKKKSNRKKTTTDEHPEEMA